MRLLLGTSLLLGACRAGGGSTAPAPADVTVAVEGRAAGAGTVDDPVDTIAGGLGLLESGQTLRLAAGRYVLDTPVEIGLSGVRIEAEDGAVLVARRVEVGPKTGKPPYEQDQGAVRITGVDGVVVQGLTIVDSHNAGITVRDSANVELRGNRTRNTFSSGIAVWSSKHVTVVENEVVWASDESLAPAWFHPKVMVAPHEAITLSGVDHFEVADNLVHHGYKEGIDVKGDSRHGVVHDNDVHDNVRQGIYVDAWEGELVDVEVRDNLVHDNRGAGIVISAEGEDASVEDVRVRHNRIQDNLGTGVFIARFGSDGPRRKIVVANNQVRHNGWGPPHEDVSPLHWITGGLYLFSANVQDVRIVDNVFVDNRAFQLGCSADYLVDGDLAAGFAARAVHVEGNVASPKPEPEPATVTTGWPRSSPDTIIPFPGGSGVSAPSSGG